jgi:hypothetical protein
MGITGGGLASLASDELRPWFKVLWINDDIEKKNRIRSPVH